MDETDTDTTSGSGTGSSTGSSGGTGSTSDAGTDTDAPTSGTASTGADDPGRLCTSDYQPVCGKDGETYDHPCSVPDGVGIRREGPCFGDCEGSCAVVGSPGLSLALSLIVLLRLRRVSR